MTAVSLLYVLPVLDAVMDGSDEVELAANTIVTVTGDVNFSEALLIGYGMVQDTIYTASGKNPPMIDTKNRSHDHYHFAHHQTSELQ